MTEKSDHDMIVHLDVRMDNVVDSVKRVEDFVKSKPCPSQLCQEHDRALERLMTTIKVIAAVSVVVAPIVTSFILFVAGYYR